MTTRYIALARVPAGWCSESHTPEERPTCTVYISDESPIDTGLVDASGITLYRVRQIAPIGFRKGNQS